MKSIYLVGSLRNPLVTEIGRKLREAGYDAFDSWFAAGPEADDYWLKYEKEKGVSFIDALYDYAAQHVFAFDLHHLQRCDAAILVLPAGKSGHLELGFMAGTGKPSFILFDKEPERWDVMYNFASMVYTNVEALVDGLGKPGTWRGYVGNGLPVETKDAKYYYGNDIVAEPQFGGHPPQSVAAMQPMDYK